MYPKQKRQAIFVAPVSPGKHCSESKQFIFGWTGRHVLPFSLVKDRRSYHDPCRRQKFLDGNVVAQGQHIIMRADKAAVCLS